MKPVPDRSHLPRSNGTEPEAKLAEAVYDWDLVTDEIRWGPNLAAVVGPGACERLLTGLAYAEHLATGSPSSRYEAVMAPGGCDTGGGVPFEAIYGLLSARRSPAPPVWIEDRGRWYADATDRPSHVHGVIRAIPEPLVADRVFGNAPRDAATGAFTRAHFIEHVTRQLALSSRRTSTFAVLILAVDPGVSGDLVDDGAMGAAAARLRIEMRSEEMLARDGATTFAILLGNCDPEQAAAAATRFIETVEAAPKDTQMPRARIGAVLAPSHGRTPEDLLQIAKEALEATRGPTRPPFVLHHPDAVRVVRPTAAGYMMSALNEGRIELALQPIVDAHTRQTVFYEALARVRHPDGTSALPDTLVTDAEKDGLVALLDERVLDLAFSMLTRDRKLCLSINASVASLHDSRWRDHLRAACKLRPDAARRLTIEITETYAIADIEATRTVLTALKLLGVKIALDDFGSGHSSFRALRQLPIDYLKIDGVFAQNLTESPDDRFFMRTLIDLAKNLQIPTVVEWVQDAETAKLLADWGVDYLQGHLFGSADIPVAMPVAKAVRF